MSNDLGRAKVLNAVAHPLRLELLIMAEDEAISPSDAAVALGEPLGTVAYHFRVLHTAGLIELVSEERRRGSIQSFYRTRNPGWGDFADKLDALASFD